ncbi:MAG: C40 family peptidase [Pyrinomonadaceae bacterium]
MNCKHFFALVAAIIIFGSSTAIHAQDDTRIRKVDRSTSVEVTDEGSRPRLVNDPIVISEAPVKPARPEAPPRSNTRLLSNRPAPFDQLMLSAIDQRIGSRYVYGSEGPNTFDCSGFVWSVYNQLGVTFERGSARSLWSRMAPVSQDEQYKFGTLVFFSGLSHVGIVADANGFYHASRSKGVVYAPFNKYWLERIDGFRQVSGPAMARLVKR